MRSPARPGLTSELRRCGEVVYRWPGARSGVHRRNEHGYQDLVLIESHDRYGRPWVPVAVLGL